MSSVFLKKIYFFNLALLILSFSLVFACFCASIKLAKSLFCVFQADRLHQKRTSERDRHACQQIFQHCPMYVCRTCRCFPRLLQIRDEDSHRHKRDQRQRHAQHSPCRTATDLQIDFFHLSTPFPVSLFKNERSFTVFKKILNISKRRFFSFSSIIYYTKKAFYCKGVKIGRPGR